MAHILLLESDKTLAANIQQALKAKGYSVDWQVEPQEATNSADNHRPDLIILDLILAGRGGVEFLYELRSYPDWQRLPIIVFSDISEQELIKSTDGLHLLNISVFHRKPHTSLAQLVATVQGLLQSIEQE